MRATVAFAAVAVALTFAVTAHARPAAASCSGGFVHARLSWGTKCLRAGEFCKVSRDVEYHRFGFHCHTGARLSRSPTRGNAVGAGCQPGYSPCLPRVADLNCADIPASKRPVRVTGSDPYRLDGNGDGIACA
jgi:hypothetical protein